jgi:SAM-dependent methyltransferase
MTCEQVLRGIQVGRNDFVVDVGGGHRPFWRADLVIEKYPFDRLHRTEAMRFPPVPVIKADALALPIPPGGCDLIFASHIIEHLPDPKGFLSEIKRCSRRVYLEFPSRNRELMMAWSFHMWLIEVHGKVLRFHRNDLAQLFGPLFHEEFDAALGAWSEARHELLNTWVYCASDEIECEFPDETATELVVRDAPRGDAKTNFADPIHRPKYSLPQILAFAAQSLLPGSVYTSLSRRRHGPSAPAPLSDAVVARLMCLRCKATTLRSTNVAITCQCGARYLQDRGVFNFDPQN